MKVLILSFLMLSLSSAHADDMAAGSLVTVATSNSSTITAQGGAPSIQVGTSSDLFTFSAVGDGVGQSFSAQKWDGSDTLHLQLSNPGPNQLKFTFGVKFASGAVFAGGFYLPPTPASEVPQVRDFIIHLRPYPSTNFGMKVNRPAISGGYVDVFGGSVSLTDLAQTTSWKIKYMGAMDANGAPVSGPVSVNFYGLSRFKQAYNMSGIIDPFGQFTDRTWNGKISAVADLSSQHVADQNDLNSHSANVVDPNQPVASVKPSTWQITQVNGNSYFVSPVDGKYVWSIGIAAVNKGNFTITSGSTPSGLDRSTFFQPRISDPNLASAATATSYNHHLQNLIYTYGTTTTMVNGKPVVVLDANAWISYVSRRLSSWGVNSVGVSSDPGLFSLQNFTGLTDTSTAVQFKSPLVTWGGLPDPFDSGFYSANYAKFKKDLGSNVSNPHMMGVYVDNELSWGGDTDTWVNYFNIPRGVLEAPSTQPAKIAFVNDLISRYGSANIAALNSNWGTSYSGFTGSCTAGSALLICMTSDPKTLSNPSLAMQKDFKDFISHYADQYFGQVKLALHDVAPGALYLGCKFSYFNQEVIAAAEKYVDVLSFNVYRFYNDMAYAPLYGTDPMGLWKFFAARKRPVLFSEFAFTMQNAGGFGGSRAQAVSTADRANALSAFLLQAGKTPNIIGAQYYGYTDEPMTGRPDMENKNFAFTDITDRPDSSMVEVMRGFAGNVYTCRQTGNNCTTAVQAVAPTPSAAILSPANGATVQGVIQVKVQISGVSNLASVRLWVSLGLAAELPASAADANGVFTFTLDSTQWTNASRSLLAAAIDSSGNRTYTPKIVVTFSN